MVPVAIQDHLVTELVIFAATESCFSEAYGLKVGEVSVVHEAS